MQIVRQTHGEAVDRWSFSYSKLKNFETCPKRHYHIDFLAKDHPLKISEPENEELVAGKMIHDLLAQRIERGTPIPEFHAHVLEPWAQRVLNGHKNAAAYRQATGASIFVERQYAIDKDFAPTPWFEKDAKIAGKKPPWYRGIADVLIVNGDVALYRDWKTGKIKDDPVQLALTAATVFAHHPKVQVVGAMFSWIYENEDSKIVIERGDLPKIWSDVMPRIKALRHAHDTHTFPPKPGGLCAKYCPVHHCPEHPDHGQTR